MSRYSILPWREYLTPEERVVIERADAAKRAWQTLNTARAGIVKRAIQRAKYELTKGNVGRNALAHAQKPHGRTERD